MSGDPDSVAAVETAEAEPQSPYESLLLAARAQVVELEPAELEEPAAGAVEAVVSTEEPAPAPPPATPKRRRRST